MVSEGSTGSKPGKWPALFSAASSQRALTLDEIDTVRVTAMTPAPTVPHSCDAKVIIVLRRGRRIRHPFGKVKDFGRPNACEAG